MTWERPTKSAPKLAEALILSRILSHVVQSIPILVLIIKQACMYVCSQLLARLPRSPLTLLILRQCRQGRIIQLLLIVKAHRTSWASKEASNFWKPDPQLGPCLLNVGQLLLRFGARSVEIQVFQCPASYMSTISFSFSSDYWCKAYSIDCSKVIGNSLEVLNLNWANSTGPSVTKQLDVPIHSLRLHACFGS